MRALRYLAAFVGLAITLFAVSYPALTQTSSNDSTNVTQPTGDVKALLNEIRELKAAQQAMQKDITEIKERIMPKGLPSLMDAEVNIEGDPVMGDKDAKVTVVEFADYQCPYCGYSYQQIYPSLVAEYVKTGKVKYVFHDFPLEQIHSNAFNASQAARCAGDQDKYWEMHNKLFQNQKSLDAKGLSDSAQAVGLDATKFQQCLASGKYQAKIRSSVEAATTIGVRGTPTFLLGLSGPNGTTFKATRRVGGAMSYASLKAAIDALLSPPRAEQREKVVEKAAERPGGGAQ